MLKKLCSALNSKDLRVFIKQSNFADNMNVHRQGTVANQIYSQLAATPKTNNTVATAFPVVQKVLPPPKAKTIYTGPVSGT